MDQAGALSLVNAWIQAEDAAPGPPRARTGEEAPDPMEERPHAGTPAGDAPGPPDAGYALEVTSGRCVVDAWGPDRASCFVQALRGVVTQYARASDPPVIHTIPLATGPAASEEVLASLVDEVIGALDVFSLVPVRFHLADTEEGGVSGDMEVVAVTDVQVVGRRPRRVDRRELSAVADAGGWRCHVLVAV